MSPCFAMIAYLPSKSVCVPIDVPFTSTLTPGRVPDESDTVPEIVFLVQRLFAQQTPIAALKFL